jgi:hypothetical protein
MDKGGDHSPERVSTNGMTAKEGAKIFPEDADGIVTNGDQGGSGSSARHKAVKVLTRDGRKINNRGTRRSSGSRSDRKCLDPLDTRFGQFW